jgi:hypothetical protein
MEQDLFQDALKKYIQREHDDLSLLKNFNLGDFNQLIFLTNEISEPFSKQLSHVRGPVLYYFKILGEYNASLICETISKMKESPGATERKLPQVNIGSLVTNTDILYVGKTQKNFAGRINQHLGFGATKTFALNLIHWDPKIDLALELNYCQIDSTHINILERIESVLHFGMTPILGRTGR